MKESRSEGQSMYDRVLIAVDGSDEAERAARRGLHVATAFDAAVDVLHVIERKSRRLVQSDHEKAALRERAEAVLDDVEELAASYDCPVSTHVVEGTPAAAICEHAADNDASLIVVGRQGLSGLRGRLFGGVTEGVLRRGDNPVLVVPKADVPRSEDTFDRVLVPTDGSKNAEAAGDHAATVAVQFDAAVHVLNVVDLQSAGGVFNAGGLDEAFVERLTERGTEAVDRLAADIQARNPGLAVETAVVQTRDFDGVPAGVREYVDDTAVDLVVMGSHGRSNLGRTVLGSVATSLVGALEVPILVVPRGAGA